MTSRMRRPIAAAAAASTAPDVGMHAAGQSLKPLSRPALPPRIAVKDRL